MAKRTNGEIINSIHKLIYEHTWDINMLSEFIIVILHSISQINNSFDFEEIENMLIEFITEYKNIENGFPFCIKPRQTKELINLTSDFYINLLNKCKL